MMKPKTLSAPGASWLATLAMAAVPLVVPQAVVWADETPRGTPPPAAGPVHEPPHMGDHSRAPPAAGKAEKGHGPPAVSTPEQSAKLLDELYARLATAPDQPTADQIAGAIEQLWMHSGSPTADLLVARASAAAEAQNRGLAMKLLNAAVELQPDYAEAWNRRAYVYYLDNDYKRALGDLRRVLALEPRHYKALEGLGNLLLQLGEKKAALEAYESALKINPNLTDARKSRDELKVQVEGQGI